MMDTTAHDHHPSMSTEVLDARQDPQTAIDRACMLINSGEVVAFPTETVYGLGARIFDARQIEKIFRAKDRPSDNPLIAHISSLHQVHDICDEISDSMRLLMQTFFPGPLTLVGYRKLSVPSIVSAGLKTIAFRMPSHTLALKLIDCVGQPIVAPSANRSGRPSPTRAEHVLHDLNGRISAVLDGGPCSIGLESTVLSMVDKEPCILRPGAITKEQIEECLGTKVLSSGAEDGVVAIAPGMKYRHYAPSIPVLQITSLDERSSLPANVVILAEHVDVNDPRVRPLRADSLYDEFRKAEAVGCVAVYVLLGPQTTSNAALMNRLQKALTASTSS